MTSFSWDIGARGLFNEGSLPSGNLCPPFRGITGCDLFGSIR
jgi:hypothetical protein